jgi:MFS family permease
MTVSSGAKRKGVMIAVLLMSFATYSNVMVAPAMAEIAKNFPDVSMANIQLIMTFGMLGYFPMTLITGFIADRIPSKPLGIIGGFLISFGALYPLVLHDHIAFLYVSNLLMGVGQGIIVTLNSIIIAQIFERKDHSKLYGWRGSVQNLASMFISFASGWLASLAWYDVFWTGLLTLPTLFACFAIPNIKRGAVEGAREAGREVASAPAEKKGVPLQCILVSILVFLFAVPYAVKMINYAILMDQQLSLGSTYAGTVLAITGLITVLGGIVYGSFSKIIKYHLFWIGTIILGAGMYVQYVSDTFIPFLIGACMTNFAFAMSFTAGIDAIPKIATPAQLSWSMGIYMAAQSLGSMLTPYLVNPISVMFTGVESAQANYIVAVVWCVITAVFALFWGLSARKYYKTPVEV